MVFPEGVYRCENQTIKKAECQKIDAFELWCRRTLDSPLDCKEIKLKSILKEINPQYSLEGLMLKLNPQNFGCLMWRTDSGKDLDAGKDWRQEEKGATEDEMVGWHQWLNGQEFVQTLGDSGGRRSLACCSPWACKESDMTERLNKIQAHVLVCHNSLCELGITVLILLMK